MSIPILLLIGVIVLVSFRAWKDTALYQKLIFSPYEIAQKNEWYRFLTSGFIHADYMHLGFNCFALYMFGDSLLDAFYYYFGALGWLVLVVLFGLGVIVSSIPDYHKYKETMIYRSLGASGGVSSVVFAGILISPMTKLYLLFIPIGIPGFIFAIGYSIYSYYMGKSGKDRINHNAHLVGGLFGVVFMLVLKPSVWVRFIEQIQNWQPF